MNERDLQRANSEVFRGDIELFSLETLTVRMGKHPEPLESIEELRAVPIMPILSPIRIRPKWPGPQPARAVPLRRLLDGQATC